MNRLISLIKGLLLPQDGDGAVLFWAKELLGALLIISFFWLLSQLISALLNKWGRSIVVRTATDLDDRILSRVIPCVSRLMIVTGLYLAIRTLPLPQKMVQVSSGILYVVLVIIVFNLLYRILDELLHGYIARSQEGGDPLLSRQVLPIAEKLAMLFLMGTALIVILKHFNYDIFSLVTALGIGSLAIGMAAKDTMAHMISGFTLMLDRPFRIGDRIQLAGGQVGDVLDIGLRSTKIKTLDNQQLVIPNSDLCNTILTNQAFPDKRAKGRINVGVAYGTDVDLVKRILVEAALELEQVLRDPPPEAFFVSFGDSSMNMALFFWIDNYADLFKINDIINTLIIRRFAENNIQIPFPTRTMIMDKG